MSEAHYDVIIVGGRCAGASLALRLADTELKVLLVDRATFPSFPNVPSSPFVHPGTMALLDKLGIPESDYTHQGSRIERFVIANFENHMIASLEMSHMNIDRNYFYGIDRKIFDETLWKHATQANGVTAYAGLSVTKILKNEAGTVQGIEGKNSEGESQTFTADLVVGADGRFSFCARQFGAEIIEQDNTHTSAAYFADWNNVDDYSADYPNAITSYRSNGQLLLIIPIAERRYAVATVMKSSDARFGGDNLESAYMERIHAVPHMAHRLKHATRMTDILGMRPIENGYRQAFGDSWALVGDALHYKDPSDGQGIYDALLESKLLSEVILNWKQSNTSWLDAGTVYQERVMSATHDMYKQTIANVKQTFYTNIPDFIFKSVVRWTLTDVDFQTQFLKYLSRQIDPASYNPNSSMPKAIWRGLLGDMRRTS